MAFFLFGRKYETSKEYFLDEIPLFSSLSSSEQRLIRKKARSIEHKKGDVIFEEGSPADGLYVVVSGRFRLFTKPRPGSEEKTLLYFYRGDHFGETSLLTGQPHSASVEAKRDGVILKLDKDDFLKFVNEIPALSLHLNRSLGHRLTRVDDVQIHREVRIASILSSSSELDGIRFWMDFAENIYLQSKRQILVMDFYALLSPVLKNEFQISEQQFFDLTTMDAPQENAIKSAVVEHPKGFHYLRIALNGGCGEAEKKVERLITFLTYRYDYILIRIPWKIDQTAFKILKQSDLVYLYIEENAGDLIQSARRIEELRQSFGFSRNEIRAVVPEGKDLKSLPYEEKEKLLKFHIFAAPPNSHRNPERYQSDLTFLSKEFTGNLLGLALGSGAAYGLAHIGVLRVLEREGIYPDVVSGSSMGALIGALWAKGLNAEQIEEIARGIDKKTGFFKLVGLGDLALPHRGFFKGKQISRWMESIFGDIKFADLRVPLKIVATDLLSSEEVIFDSGNVVDAVRASISIPGIFQPVRLQGRLLIDGGVIDPLPVAILAKMGVRKIIAVNVLLGSKDRVEQTWFQDYRQQFQAAVSESQGVWDRIILKGWRKMQNRYEGNVFNVIMNTIQFMEYEIAEASSDRADIVIHPVVQEGHWAEFHSPDKFIKEGEERTLEQIEDIKKLLTE